MSTALPGIPTIRVFEALACGIPLVCAPWDDAEGLFSPGDDFLVARDGDGDAPPSRRRCAPIRTSPPRSRRTAARPIEARHTCAHRVDELLAICRSLGRDLGPPTDLAAAQ